MTRKSLLSIAASATFLCAALAVVAQDTKAHSDKCKNRLKNVGLGMAMYISDNDDVFPPSTLCRWKLLQWMIGPYTKNEPLKCPAQQKDYSFNEVLGDKDIFYSQKNKTRSKAKDTPMSLFELNAPAMTPMLHDGTRGVIGRYHTDPSKQVKVAGKTQPHAWGFVLMTDTSVKSFPPGKNTTLAWNAGLK